MFGAGMGVRGVVRAVLSSPRQSYEAAAVCSFGLFSLRHRPCMGLDQGLGELMSVLCPYESGI